MVFLLEEKRDSRPGTSVNRRVPEQAMVTAVREALERTDEIQGIALCSGDGLPIVDAFTGRRDAVTIAAMSELIRRSGARVFQHLGYEGPEYVVLRGKDVDVVVTVVSPYATVIAVTEVGANLGMVQLVLRDLTEDLAPLLER